MNTETREWRLLQRKSSIPAIYHPERREIVDGEWCVVYDEADSLDDVAGFMRYRLNHGIAESDYDFRIEFRRVMLGSGSKLDWEIYR